MKNGWNKFSIIALSMVLVLNIYIISKFNRLERNIQDLSSQIYHVDNSIHAISDHITSDIKDLLEKQNSIISDFKYNFNSFDDGKMSLALKVLPKEYSTQATYYFSYLLKDGTTNSVKADVNDGNYLIADIILPLGDGIEINYIEEVGSQRRMEKLDSLGELEEELLEPFNLEEGPSTMSFGTTNDHRLLDNIYMVSYDFTYDSFEDDEGIESAEVYLSLDGDIIDTFPMNKKTSISTPSREIYQYHFKNYKLDFQEEDMIDVYAIVTHSKGFKVKLVLGTIYKDMDYQVEPVPWEEMKSLIYED